LTDEHQKASDLGLLKRLCACCFVCLYCR